MNFPITPQIHSELSRKYSINLDSDEYAISSLVFSLNRLGFRTVMSCGGHYEQLDKITNCDKHTYRPIIQSPWANFQYTPHQKDLVDQMNPILDHFLWTITLREDCAGILLPNPEYTDELNKLHIQQFQKESVDISHKLVNNLCVNHNSSELDLILQHKEILVREQEYLNS